MIKEILISGPDGRNVVSSAITLAAAGVIDHGYAALAPPGVGVGPKDTVHCPLVISSSPVMATTIPQPDAAIAMDYRAALSSWQLLKPEGCLFVNAGSPVALTRRGLCRVACLNCTAIAKEVGDPKLGFLVMLAVMVKHTGLVTESTLREAHRRKFASLGNKQLRLRELVLEKGFRDAELAFYGSPASATKPSSVLPAGKEPVVAAV
jgi:Pyruvate/2-oxoacid:ferredoxin oxidoreductase gamma subunit